MKEVNLISLCNTIKSLDNEAFSQFKLYHSIIIKDEEIEDIETLTDFIKTVRHNVSLFDKYFVGYSIPQIGKEFDLLRIGIESIVNIELKSSSTEEKIKKQLVLNKHYLSFLKKELHFFTYVTNENKLFTLSETNDLIEVNVKALVSVLVSQNVKKIKDIDNLFNPSDYLVSPFNSTQEFIKRKYFLTTHQDKIKKEVINQLSSSLYSILSINLSLYIGL